MGGGLGNFVELFLPSAQGHDREVLFVEVVAEVEDFWESSAGEPLFGLRSVGILGLAEVFDASDDVFILWAKDC